MSLGKELTRVTQAEELIQAQARVLPEPNVVRRISLASEDRPDLVISGFVVVADFAPLI